MKRILTAAALFVLIGAQAAPLPLNFTDTNGTNFSIENAASIDKVGRTISVITMYADENGTTVPVAAGYADSNGTVWAKMVGTFNSTGLYLRVGASNRYIGAKAIKYTYCSAPYSMLFYGAGKTEANETFNDGCALTQGVKALSN